MGLQNYEIGSEVSTPYGVGTVVKFNRNSLTVTVHTARTQGTFKIEELEGWVARELPPDELDEWLEAPPVTAHSTGTLTTSKPCACRCGARGACYWSMRGTTRLAHFVNGDCRCRVNGCGCDR